MTGVIFACSSESHSLCLRLLRSSLLHPARAQFVVVTLSRESGVTYNGLKDNRCVTLISYVGEGTVCDRHYCACLGESHVPCLRLLRSSLSHLARAQFVVTVAGYNLITRKWCDVLMG